VNFKSAWRLVTLHFYCLYYIKLWLFLFCSSYYFLITDICHAIYATLAFFDVTVYTVSAKHSARPCSFVCTNVPGKSHQFLPNAAVDDTRDSQITLKTFRFFCAFVYMMFRDYLNII